jgi:hypothetical protein
LNTIRAEEIRKAEIAGGDGERHPALCLVETVPV